jgi:ribosome biogenesis GTPase
MKAKLEEGLVIRVTGGEVWVQVPGRIAVCSLRGRLRKMARDFRVVAGDIVSIAWVKSQPDKGTIEAIHPRKSFLSRLDATRNNSEKIIVANLDLLFLISSLKEPAVHYEFLDRVLVSAERGNTCACICLNKVDLADNGTEIGDFVDTYESCGYRVILTSALRGDGIETLGAMLSGGIYAFVGASGVGKSSILMKLDPELDLKIGRLAVKTGRGRHTTSFSQLYPLKGGYVADTPGIQTFGLPGSDVGELSACFPEFGKFESECKFRPCTHSHEPGCAVKAAHEGGLIRASRYKSYVSMLAELEGRERRRFS